MYRLLVLGSSAAYPFPRTKSNKFGDYLVPSYEEIFPLHNDPICLDAIRGSKSRRMRASLAIITPAGNIFLDAGPDIKMQMEKYRIRPDVILLTHSHLDATYGARWLPEIPALGEITHGFKPGMLLEYFGIRIIPFRVQHAKDTPTVGFRLTIADKHIVYMSDLGSLRGVRKNILDADILFSDGSILAVKTIGHLPIVNQLRYYKKLGIPRVIFTHIGHNTLPHNELDKYVKKIYANAEIAFDGQEIDI